MKSSALLIAAALIGAAALLSFRDSDRVAPHHSPPAPPTLSRGSHPAAPRVTARGGHTAATPLPPRAPHEPDPRVDDVEAGCADSCGSQASPRAGEDIRSTLARSAATPASTTTAPDDGVARLMYCHPDSRGAFGAADVLQECLDRAPAFSSIEIPAGRYVLERQVVVSRPVTVRTAGSGGTTLSCRATPEQCATLVASPDLFEAFGFLLVRSTGSVAIEHLVLDGNRAARLSSTAAQFCQLGRTSYGFNASVIDCDRCAVADVVSMNALCGTAMLWSGAQAVIERSEFRDNGDAATPRMWADGLTAVYAPASDIRDNVFADNSDVGLIIGHGARSRIERNRVIQRTQRAFAGLMLHNFHSNNLAFRGDFRDAVIARNLVDCASRLCVFGIQAGPAPWDPTRNIVGGEVQGNEVRGAKIGINVDGAGIRLAPIAVFGNRVVGAPAGAYFADCARRIPAGWMNVSPISVVDRREDALPTGAHLSDACQLWSELVPASVTVALP